MLMSSFRLPSLLFTTPLWPALSHWSVGGKLGLGVVGSRFASTVSWLCDAGQLLISGLSMGRLACPAKQPGEFVKKFIDSISDRIL